MNDLRTTSGVLGADAARDNGISAAPPRVRPERDADGRAASRKMSRRQSIAERARQEAVRTGGDLDAADVDRDAGDDRSEGLDAPAAVAAKAEQTLFDDEAINAKLARRASRRAKPEGPESRPTRRRAVDEREDENPPSETGFPWNYHLSKDGDPEELHASTPLLSRAFRATTG